MAASEPVLRHEVGIECAHRRLLASLGRTDTMPIDDTLFSRPKRYFPAGDRMEDQ